MKLTKGQELLWTTTENILNELDGIKLQTYWKWHMKVSHSFILTYNEEHYYTS